MENRTANDIHQGVNSLSPKTLSILYQLRHRVIHQVQVLTKLSEMIYMTEEKNKDVDGESKDENNTKKRIITMVAIKSVLVALIIWIWYSSFTNLSVWQDFYVTIVITTVALMAIGLATAITFSIKVPRSVLKKIMSLSVGLVMSAGILKIASDPLPPALKVIISLVFAIGINHVVFE